MVSEQQAALLAQSKIAIIGINRASGGPQLTAVWFFWDGKDFYISTSKDRAKYRNIKRNPAISLLVEDSANFVSVTAYGQAKILEHNVVELTRPIIEKYVPEATRESMLKDVAKDANRVVVVLHPEKII